VERPIWRPPAVSPVPAGGRAFTPLEGAGSYDRAMRANAIVSLGVAVALASGCAGAGDRGTAAPAADELVLTEYAEPRPVPVPHRRIHPVLQAALADAGQTEAPADGAVLTYVVVDDRGYPLAAQHAERPVMPASTMKLVTAAAALRILGPAHRYITEVRTGGAPSADGRVDGDLVLVGSGDPALATAGYGDDVYPVRPRTPIEDLADGVVAAGVREITGSIVADASILAEEPLAAGWPAHYLADLDTTPVSGLTVDAGRVLEWTEDGRVLATPADDPAVHTASRFAVLLEERGVVVHGSVRLGTASTSHRLATVTSPPLEDLLRHAIQRSDNHMSDGIYRTLGAVGRGDGTWHAAAAATREALDDLELDWNGVVLADGSGLSRDDRLTASFLVQLDRAMAADLHAAAWDRLMAVAGESGTLSRRLRGTSAEGALRGKTGALTDVRSFAGSVHGPDGQRYHLAVLGNEVGGAGRGLVREIVDRFAQLLADDLRCGTTLVPRDPAEASVGAPVEGADGSGSADEEQPPTLVCA
jgi:serine-type D-Ala-D-Ala carboxypeptidase/endopeptidase (penicillin-binding protein 4)